MSLKYIRKSEELLREIDDIMPGGENKEFDRWLFEVENLLDDMIMKIDYLEEEVKMLEDN